MRTYLILFFFVTAFISEQGLAATCKNVNNVPTIVGYDLTTTLTDDENQVGHSIELKKSQDISVKAICPQGSSPNGTISYRSYVSNYPIVETDGSWKYLELAHGYLEGAMKIHDSAKGDFYPPVNYFQMGKDVNINAGQPFGVGDSNLTFRIKILKSFIGTMTIPALNMFNVYVTTKTTDPLNVIVYIIAYGGVISAPEHCEINAGQIIEVNLGSLSSGSFNRAGQKPDDAEVKTFNVPIKCNGDVSSIANVTLRVQATADTNISQAIASDNTDVGVVVADQSGKVLVPNDPTSTVPFTTDTTGEASVTLQTYPISTTGQPPAEGLFTALAFLRIDFA